jgi:hypothetical protein
MAKASLLGLRFAMIGTFAVVTAVASLVLMAILTWLGIPFLGQACKSSRAFVADGGF